MVVEFALGNWVCAGSRWVIGPGLGCLRCHWVRAWLLWCLRLVTVWSMGSRLVVGFAPDYWVRAWSLCMHVCMYVCVYACVFICMFMCMLMCMFMCMFMCICITHVCVRVCMCVCVAQAMGAAVFRAADGGNETHNTHAIAIRVHHTHPIPLPSPHLTPPLIQPHSSP